MLSQVPGIPSPCHGGIVSMKLRASVALASSNNVVRSDGNGLVYQESVELFG